VISSVTIKSMIFNLWNLTFINYYLKLGIYVIRKWERRNR